MEILSQCKKTVGAALFGCCKFLETIVWTITQMQFWLRSTLPDKVVSLTATTAFPGKCTDCTFFRDTSLFGPLDNKMLFEKGVTFFASLFFFFYNQTRPPVCEFPCESPVTFCFCCLKAQLVSLENRSCKVRILSSSSSSSFF